MRSSTTEGGWNWRDGWNWRHGFSTPMRWIIILVLAGGAVVAAKTLVTDTITYNDMARNGVIVSADVEQDAPYDDDRQYLLSFTIDGQHDQQWASDIGPQTVGGTVSVVVNRNDHTDIVNASGYRLRWFLFAFVAVAMLAALGLAIAFIRMTSEEFSWTDRGRFRFGRF